MTKGEFEKRVTGSTSEAVYVSALDQYGKPRGEMISKTDFLKWLDDARKEYPTEESVIAKAPEYWAGLEGISEYRTVLRNNVDAERSQWFLKWLGSQNAEK